MLFGLEGSKGISTSEKVEIKDFDVFYTKIETLKDMKKHLLEGSVVLVDSKGINLNDLAYVLGDNRSYLIESENKVAAYFVYVKNSKLCYGLINNQTGSKNYSVIVDNLMATLHKVKVQEEINYHKSFTFIDDFGKNGKVINTHDITEIVTSGSKTDYIMKVNLIVEIPSEKTIDEVNLTLNAGYQSGQTILSYSNTAIEAYKSYSDVDLKKKEQYFKYWNEKTVANNDLSAEFEGEITVKDDDENFYNSSGYSVDYVGTTSMSSTNTFVYIKGDDTHTGGAY